MKIKIATAFASLVLFLGAQKFSSQNSNQPSSAVESRDWPMHDPAEVFNEDLVDKLQAPPDSKVKAHQLYQQAQALFAGKHEVKASLPVFLKALCTSNEAYIYKGYGDALYADGEYDKALQSYRFCAELSDSLSAAAYFGEAKCQAKTGKSDATETVQAVLEKEPGFVNKIANDDAFADLLKQESFQVMLASYNPDPKTRKERLLPLFAKNFTNVPAPYQIPIDSLNNYHGKRLDYYFDELIPGMASGMFSRGTPKDFQVVASINISAAYNTFIYRAVDFVGDSLFPTRYYLLNLDANGNKLAQQQIACSCSPVSLETAIIDTDGIVEVKKMTQVWQHDPVENGYEGNKVIKRDLKSVKLYQIAADGRLAPVQERPAKPNVSTQAVNSHP